MQTTWQLTNLIIASFESMESVAMVVRKWWNNYIQVCWVLIIILAWIYSKLSKSPKKLLRNDTTTRITVCGLTLHWEKQFLDETLGVNFARKQRVQRIDWNKVYILHWTVRKKMQYIYIVNTLQNSFFNKLLIRATIFEAFLGLATSFYWITTFIIIINYSVL